MTSSDDNQYLKHLHSIFKFFLCPHQYTLLRVLQYFPHYKIQRMKPQNIYIKGYIQQQSFIFSRNKLINKKRSTLMQLFCQTTTIFPKFSMKHSLCFKFFFSFCVLLCYNPTRKGHFSPLVHEVRCANFFLRPLKDLSTILLFSLSPCLQLLLSVCRQKMLQNLFALLRLQIASTSSSFTVCTKICKNSAKNS